MTALKPNDTVYLVPFGNAVYYNGHASYVTGVVDKIGRKYVHIKLSERNTVRMELGTDHAETNEDCNAYYKVFDSWQSYLNWKKTQILSDFIEQYFRYTPKLPLSALESIYNTIHDADPARVNMPLDEYIESEMAHKN